MSSESLAMLRKNYGDELAKLAEDHLQNDLQPKDRDNLNAAAKSLGTWATAGSIIGLGLGAALAFSIRRNRMNIFQAMKGAEKPTHITFASGRTEPLPDISAFAKPTTLGDIAAYSLFSAGGLFVGGELGLLGGGAAANRTISSDPDSRARIETAFKKFRADVLRKEADALDKSTSTSSLW